MKQILDIFFFVESILKKVHRNFILFQACYFSNYEYSASSEILSPKIPAQSEVSALVNFTSMKIPLLENI